MHSHLEYPVTPFHGLLERTAERLPQKTAIVFKGRRITFAEWNSLAGSVACGLRECGIRKGDRVAFFMPNCPEYQFAFFACSRLGAIPTPLNPSYKAREVRYQLVDSGAAAIVVHTSLFQVLDSVRQELPAVRLVLTVGGPAPAGAIPFDRLAEHTTTANDLTEIGEDDLAALPYSSGTTGASKGVMLTHRNLVRNAVQYVEATQTTADDAIMIFLPLYHIYGVVLMAISAASGATQVLMERFDLVEAVRLIGAEAVTELYVVPPVMLALANAPELRPEQFSSLRFAMSAAAPLSPEIARRVSSRLQIRVIQAYGMTEASPLTHMVPLDLPGDTMESVGIPVADTECHIMELAGGERELPVGEVGEVTIRGPQVMAGYWNAPQETARTLRDGWLYTGDVGKVDAGDNLFIVDRKKEMIKYKGFSIAPAELEAVLLEHPAVLDCAVTARPDLEAGEVPHAWIVLRAGAVVSAEELQEFVKERVAGYKQIRSIQMIDTIPRTPSGKILRRVLRETPYP